jgi:hypothetical protein
MKIMSAHSKSPVSNFRTLKKKHLSRDTIPLITLKATAEASRCSQEVEELEARLERAEAERGKWRRQEASLRDSVPNPDPPDPRVFGPLGSVSSGQMYGSRSGSGSGSFYHHAKITRKTLNPAIS